MSERALVTVETITDIVPIEGADAIEAARVRGWTVVVKRGQFRPGERAAYFEIDSFLPFTRPAYAFLEPRGSKTVDGVAGHVLRTAKLRGVVSQGLLLGLDEAGIDPATPAGTDITEAAGVTKWEPPIPADLAGTVIGPFPTRYARKTDSERVQNLGAHWDQIRASSWYASEKIDGTSLTVICDDNGELRVCGRNWEYAESENNTMWKVAREHLAGRLEPGMYVQAELFGEGIQANPLKIRGQRIAVFIVGRDAVPLPHDEWPAWAAELAVPVYDDLELPDTIEATVAQADGIRSKISPDRLAEGVVWHATDGRPRDFLDGRANFKAISNRFLLKHGG